MIKDSSQAPEQNDWQEFKPLFGGGKIKLCDTLRAVTPFGGLSVLIEFFGRIGLVEQLQERRPYQPKNPNHYVPVLVMHSEDDQIVPYQAAGPLSAKLLKKLNRIHPRRLPMCCQPVQNP